MDVRISKKYLFNSYMKTGETPEKYRREYKFQ